MSLPMVLFLIFLVLKLTHTINWSWWWVTSPLWIAAAVVLFCSLVEDDRRERYWRRNRYWRR